MSDELKYSMDYVDLGLIWWSTIWAAVPYPLLYIEDEFWGLR